MLLTFSLVAIFVLNLVENSYQIVDFSLFLKLRNEIMYLKVIF